MMHQVCRDFTTVYCAEDTHGVKVMLRFMELEWEIQAGFGMEDQHAYDPDRLHCVWQLMYQIYFNGWLPVCHVDDKIHFEDVMDSIHKNSKTTVAEQKRDMLEFHHHLCHILEYMKTTNANCYYKAHQEWEKLLDRELAPYETHLDDSNSSQSSSEPDDPHDMDYTPCVTP